jgi:hypothetical protein
MTPTQQFFDSIEHTDLSEWIAGPSMLAFPTILTIHVLGTGFLAGTSVAIALRFSASRAGCRCDGSNCSIPSYGSRSQPMSCPARCC